METQSEIKESFKLLLLASALTLALSFVPFAGVITLPIRLFVTFIHEIEGIVTFTDFMAGFVKSFVFAITVAGVGCLRGLQTAAGASAVGDSATRAVVSGIILLVVIDGVFAVIYFLIDI